MRTNTSTKERVYFAGVSDPAQLQILYRALALQHHPDRGGDLATMQSINAQYDEARKRLEAPAPERRYTPPQPKPKTKPADPFEQVSYTPSPDAAVAGVLAQHRCPGVFVEHLNGETIARGQTYENRETLKNLGFWWSPELRAWHFVRKPGQAGKGAAN